MRSVSTLGQVPFAVLIAEDKVHLRKMFKDWFKHEFPKVTAFYASDIQEARSVAAAERLDLILVDIDMPEGRGFELLRAIRTELPEVKLIALSMFQADAYRDYAAGAGATACMSMTSVGPKLKGVVSGLVRSGGGAKG